MSPVPNFACVLNCMDGRVQESVIDYVKKATGSIYIDNITMAGPVAVMLDHSRTEEIKHVHDRISISRDKHGANTLFVMGHCHCAGLGPVPDPEQVTMVHKLVKELREAKAMPNIHPIWCQVDPLTKEWYTHALQE